MVYYPLSVVMLAGIREVLVLSTPEDIGQYKRLLGDGSQWGITLQYKIQKEPKGLAEAFVLGEDFIGEDPVCLILGDNIFYGLDFSEQLETVVEQTKLGHKATIFGYTVKDPQRYGVIEFDAQGKALSIEEKPEHTQKQSSGGRLVFLPQ